MTQFIFSRRASKLYGVSKNVPPCVGLYLFTNIDQSHVAITIAREQRVKAEFMCGRGLRSLLMMIDSCLYRCAVWQRVGRRLARVAWRLAMKSME